jgi:hypothetical protein
MSSRAAGGETAHKTRSGTAVLCCIAVVVAIAGTSRAAGREATAAAPARQNDAGSRRDAGNSFEEATRVKPRGFYRGRLDHHAGDGDDFYKFSLPQDGFVSVLVGLPSTNADPITVLDPNGNVVDVGVKVQGTGVTVGSGFTSELRQVRVAVHRAAVAGDYRLRLQSDRFEVSPVLHEL